MLIEEEFKIFLQAVAGEYNLSRAEREVFTLAVEGHDIPVIAEQLEIKHPAVRQRLSEVYKIFQIEGRGPVKLTKLRQMLLLRYQQKQAENSRSDQQHQSQNTTAQNTTGTSASSNQGEQYFHPHQSWDEVPDISVFYGREQELATLKQWIVTDKYPLVLLMGMGGIGKTILSVKLVRQVQNEFDYIIRKSLYDAPPLNEVLTDIIKFLSEDEEITIPSDRNGQISLLIKCLSQHRCLLVLDDIDVVLSTEEMPDYLQIQQNGYGELLKQVGKSHHQSCLLLNCREKPLEITSSARERLPLQILQLGELADEDAQQIILSTTRFPGLEEKLPDLIQLYGGHPLLLKLVAMILHDLEEKDVIKFIKKNTLLISTIFKKILNTRFGLTDLENNILLWLALNSKALSLTDLELNVVSLEENTDLATALISLVKQSLIEEQNQGDNPKFALSYQMTKSIVHRLLARYFNQIGYNKYLSKSELASAKECFIMALRYGDTLAITNYNLGTIYEDINDKLFARKHYKIALQEKNNNGYAAINNLARLEIIEGNNSEAIKQIEAILEGVRDTAIKASLHKNLGWAYFEQGCYEEAEHHLQMSLELENNYVPAYCLLAKVQEAKGNQQGALKAWRNCLECDFNHPQQKGGNWKLPEVDIWRLEARRFLKSVDNKDC